MTPNPTKTFLVLFFFFSTLQNSSAYLFHAFELRDLEPNDPSFINEANAWSANALVGANKHSQCGSTYMLGGYNVLGSLTTQNNRFFSKTVIGLSSHTYIYFSFTLWVIDSWDADDSMQIEFDSVIFTSWTLKTADFPSHLCGNTTFKDSSIRVFGRFPHTSALITIRFRSFFDELSSNESFGVRDFILLMVKKPTAAGNSQEMCGIAPMNLASRECSCPEGQFRSGGTCNPCHNSCQSCFASTRNNCYQCKSGFFWDGEGCIKCHNRCEICYGENPDQCTKCKTGNYLFQNHTCIPSCGSPLIQGTQGTEATCSLPCDPGLNFDVTGECVLTCHPATPKSAVVSVVGPVPVCRPLCPAGKYLYWDGSCHDTCITPVVSMVNGSLYCAFPCTTPANPILYWDGSCNNTCAEPLSYEIHYGEEFCKYPCVTGEYLYNNGSCRATCDNHFVDFTFAGEKFCYFPCAANQYLYSNGSCLSKCATTFYNLTMRMDKYCYYPCDPAQYIFRNGSCGNYCPFHADNFTLVGEKYCNYTCPFGVNTIQNGTCVNDCPPYFFSSYYDGRRFCDYPCESSEYLYSNGTCASTCLSNYLNYNYTYAIGIDKFCDYPCRPSEFLYSNGSCLLYCHPHFFLSSYQGENLCTYPCNPNEYLYYNGSCHLTCNFPLIPKTYGTEHFCDSPCYNPNEYLYKNGSCFLWCPSQFIEWSKGSHKYCDYPCLPGEYLYYNGSCLSSCRADFIPKTYGVDLFCDFPCDADVYLYQNGSCLSNCPSPWREVNDNGNLYCSFICENITHFMYWNGSCESYCPVGFQQYIEDNYKFCLFPCLSTEYLYPNFTCKEHCISPLRPQATGDFQYCRSPCSTTQYLLWDDTCVNYCYSPFRAQDGYLDKLCNLPCDDPNDYYYEETGICSKTCLLKPVVEKGIYKKCVPLGPDYNSFMEYISTTPGDSGTPTFIVLNKIIHNIRYLDIQYPPRLQNLCLGKGRSILSLQYGWSIPDSMLELFPQHDLPSNVFVMHDLHSSFLVNFWQSLTTFAIILAIIIILSIAEFICNLYEMEDWKLILERILVILRWNLILILIATTACDVVLFASLEFNIVRLDSIGGKFSFAVCIFVLLVYTVIIFFAGYLALRAQEAKAFSFKTQSFTEYVDFLTKYQGFQVAFRGFVGENVFQNMFYIVYTARITTPMIIASFIYLSPLIETSMYLLVSVGILIYLLYIRPLQKRINFIQVLIIEVLVFIIHFSMFMLTIIDVFETHDRDLFIRLGDVVIFCNFMLNILAIVFLVLKIFQTIFAAVNLQNYYFSYSFTMLLQVITLPIQQGAFGFEQIQILKFENFYAEQFDELSSSFKDNESKLRKVPRLSEHQRAPNSNARSTISLAQTESTIMPLTEFSEYRSTRNVFLNRLVSRVPSVPLHELEKGENHPSLQLVRENDGEADYEEKNGKRRQIIHSNRNSDREEPIEPFLLSNTNQNSHLINLSTSSRGRDLPIDASFLARNRTLQHSRRSYYGE